MQDQPPATWLQRAIEARGIACNLRNMLEELQGELAALTGEEDVLDDAVEHSGELETELDRLFSLDRFPSPNPTTWRKDK